jgi:hypothetical protein
MDKQANSMVGYQWDTKVHHRNHIRNKQTKEEETDEGKKKQNIYRHDKTWRKMAATCFKELHLPTLYQIQKSLSIQTHA